MLTMHVSFIRPITADEDLKLSQLSQLSFSRDGSGGKGDP